MLNLIDRQALIIGASGAVGTSIALELVSKGAKLILHTRSIESSKLLTAKLYYAVPDAKSRKAITAITHSFTIEDFVTNSSMGGLSSFLSTIDILVVAYGPFTQDAIDKTTSEQWRDIALYNLSLPGMLISRVLPGMIERHRGSILVFGGTRTDSIRAYKSTALYSASKSALSVLVKSTAAAYGPYGISCNAILPGFIDSPNYLPATRKALEAKSPRGILIASSDIAKVALELIVSDSINGALVNIDQGYDPLYDKSI